MAMLPPQRLITDFNGPFVGLKAMLGAYNLTKRPPKQDARPPDLDFRCPPLELCFGRRW